MDKVQESNQNKNFSPSPEFLAQLRNALNRKKNEKKVSKEEVKKKEQIRKAKRRAANKSRKINQAKNRRNKFQRKK